MHRSRWMAAALLVVLGACGRSQAATSRSEETVDSVMTREAALARFRAGLSDPETLSYAAPTLADLVGQFVTAVEAADTAALGAMSLTRAEFAFLYYETNPESRPPYDLAPGLMWEMVEMSGRRGLYHLLEQRAGQPLGYRGVRCDAAVSVQGTNRVHGPCLVQRRAADGTPIEERLFGLIVERAGRFKFVSLANSLD